MALIVPRISTKLRQYVPLLEMVSQSEWERNLGDRLSLLYVSMTRARRVLNLVFQVKRPKSPPKLSAGEIVRGSIPELNDAYLASDEDEHGRFWMRTAVDWNDQIRIERTEAEPIREPRRIRIVKNGESDTVVSPSTTEKSSHDSFQIIDTGSRRRGTLLHELFRTIAWLDEGEPSDEEISKAFVRTAMLTGRPVSQEEKSEALEVLSDSIGNEIIASRLRQGVYDPMGCDDLQVLNEWPVLSSIDGSLVRGRIDRLVIGRTKGVIGFIEIVDYKSGRIRDEVAEKEAVLRYSRQIHGYTRIVREHFGIDEREVPVTGRLLFIESGRDVPCLPCPTDH